MAQKQQLRARRRTPKGGHTRSLTCIERAAQEEECQGGSHAHTQQHPSGGVLEQAVGLQGRSRGRQSVERDRAPRLR
jgi:hypothetical protein